MSAFRTPDGRPVGCVIVFPATAQGGATTPAPEARHVAPYLYRSESPIWRPIVTEQPSAAAKASARLTKLQGLCALTRGQR